MLAYDYPLMGLFWTMLWWFLWIAWIILLFKVIVDIFRSHDMGGGGKALWAIFVVLIPWLGVLVYLIARGHSMAERDHQQIVAQQDAFRSYVQDVATSGGGAGTADELAKLAQLRDAGAITAADYETLKAKLVG